VKRQKPDPYRVAVFLAIAVRFDPSFETPAAKLWLRWKRYAGKHRAQPGTPRSFSNALRKVGCAWARRPGARTRIHRGLQLAPSSWPDPPPMRSVNWTDEHGRQHYAGIVHVNPADGQPMMLMRRGLLPPIYVPAQVVRRDGRYWLERRA